MLNNFILGGRWFSSCGKGFLTGLNKDLIDVRATGRGAFKTLLYPVSDRLPQLLCPWIMATRCSV